jgi:adenylate cyclase
MAADEGQRKLAAILAADVAGYSRLMADDERATVRTLTEYREVFTEHVEAHQGRVVDTAGDSVLATFDSVVEAVEAAVEVQSALAECNERLPEHRRMQFRIGVNLGDIIIRDDGTVYGDGVNVAARLESLAEPSGVMLSEDAYRQVRTKTTFGFADAGEHKVKNIAEPVRVYRWTDAAADSIPGMAGAEGALLLPDKSSIAVLPFVNMSDDAEQEYFADGLTEDIITELSRFQTFFVIARNSSFAYKGQSINVGKIGQELGVAYVVEGSVRKASNRVRITAQLVEAASGNHIWAERYDHDLTDMFDVQDEVTRSIVAAVPGRLESADLNRIKRKRPEDMAVYDYVLRGKMHHHRGTKDDNTEALRLLDKAIDLDPQFAESYAWKACTLGQALARGFGDNKEELFAQDVEAVEKALSLDENNFECHWIMCEVRMMVARLEEAELHHQKAFALNPNDPRVVAQRSELLTWLGRPVEGVDWARQAMRLDPYNAAGRAHLLGRALYMARSYADAIKAFKQVRVPGFSHHAEIAACYAQLGSDEKAGLHAGKVLSLKPDFSIADHVQGLPFKESQDREQYQAGLCKAGLPE